MEQFQANLLRIVTMNISAHGSRTAPLPNPIVATGQGQSESTRAYARRLNMGWFGGISFFFCIKRSGEANNCDTEIERLDPRAVSGESTYS